MDFKNVVPQNMLQRKESIGTESSKNDDENTHISDTIHIFRRY